MSAAQTARAACAPAGPGRGTGEADLWCTYAAVRTLHWLDRGSAVESPERTVRYLGSRRNSDGGYAWIRGMASDAWATFYCTQALRDLGAVIESTDATADWLRGTWTGRAYGMQPGQHADVWATHFSVRTQVQVCGRHVPDPAALHSWLGDLQGADGGLCWAPEHAAAGRRSDVRACYYGVVAWAESGLDGPPPWDLDRLVGWIRGMQDDDGGFRLHEGAPTPCLWATYRASGALRVLGVGPEDTDGCVAWIHARRRSRSAFVRWPDYDQEDVWASFCAIGSLRACDASVEEVSDAVVDRVREFACDAGGYTYVPPERAGDALSTASAVLIAPDDPAAPQLREWLEGCRLPNEDGVMYMPGRGSEVRCTLWALVAGAFAGNPQTRAEIASWIGDLQNPDGGVGYWEGRGSDLVSTVSALETLRLVAATPAKILDIQRLREFVDSCRAGDGHGNVPGGPARLRSGLHAQRILDLLGDDRAAGTAALLARHEVRGGGFADVGHRIPDLLSTYEAAATAARLRLPVDRGRLRVFADRVVGPAGTSWSPLAPDDGGPLASCLGTLLNRWLRDPAAAPPALTLS